MHFWCKRALVAEKKYIQVMHQRGGEGSYPRTCARSSARSAASAWGSESSRSGSPAPAVSAANLSLLKFKQSLTKPAARARGGFAHSTFRYLSRAFADLASLGILGNLGFSVLAKAVFLCLCLLLVFSFCPCCPRSSCAFSFCSPVRVLFCLLLLCSLVFWLLAFLVVLFVVCFLLVKFKSY